MDHGFAINLWQDSPCDERVEEALHLYLDGELPLGDESMLFTHLAACDGCRRQFGALMEFRRIIRLDVVSVPPAVDDQFFSRLDQVRRDGQRRDRFVERRPLWQHQAPVSLRSAAAAAILLFCAGLFLPRPLGDQAVAGNAWSPIDRRLESVQSTRMPVFGLDEKVELPTNIGPRGEAVYIFYPGLTVEASKLEDPESL